MPATPPPLSQSASNTSRPGPWIVAALVFLLLILHQDNWFWTDGRLVLGFMPIGLFWHACISIAASLVWFLTTKIAWPVEPEFEKAVVADLDSPAHLAKQGEIK